MYMFINWVFYLNIGILYIRLIYIIVNMYYFFKFVLFKLRIVGLKKFNSKDEMRMLFIYD